MFRLARETGTIYSNFKYFIVTFTNCNTLGLKIKKRLLERLNNRKRNGRA